MVPLATRPSPGPRGAPSSHVEGFEVGVPGRPGEVAELGRGPRLVGCDPTTVGGDPTTPSGMNFVSSTQPGMGLGPTEDVPGLGTVNVPNLIQEEAATVPPGKEMNSLVWDWARFVNSQVPYYTYTWFKHQQTYSTKNYTNWPQADSVPIQVEAYNGWGGIELMFQMGYFKAA